MAALSAIRDTVKLDGSPSNLQGYPQKGNTKIWFGAFVVLNAGLAAPGSTATGLSALGRARVTSDNTGGADAAIDPVLVESGTFKWDNSTSGDAITQANAGSPCYIVDDHTVALTNGSGTRSLAGIIRRVDTDGVWVQSGLGVSA